MTNWPLSIEFNCLYLFVCLVFPIIKMEKAFFVIELYQIKHSIVQCIIMFEFVHKWKLNEPIQINIIKMLFGKWKWKRYYYEDVRACVFISIFIWNGYMLHDSIFMHCIAVSISCRNDVKRVKIKHWLNINDNMIITY